MTTHKEILFSGVAELKQADKQTARLDARVLLSHTLGIEPEDLLQNEVELSKNNIEKFKHYITRRAQGEPVARIIGKRDFWNSTFLLAPDVFDPRPETELLVEVALENQHAKQNILDLGTGTGCILLSILAERGAYRGVGIDISAAAVHLARKNARALKLTQRAHFICADWRAGLSGNFDLITSNPPYIAADEIPHLSQEVKGYDPEVALVGGADGLAVYRDIARLAPNLLKREGRLLLELGAGQAAAVQSLFDSKLWQARTYKDLSGIVRLLGLVKLT